MRKSVCIIGAALAALLFASCGTTRGLKSEVYSELYGEKPPVSILVMPPINNSTNVDAKDYFYCTLNQTLADAGYYVYPSLLAMETLQSESAYDSELFVEGDISKFGSTFGADLLMFTTITEWKKSVIGSKVTVGIDYRLRATATGNTVYHRAATFVCDTKQNTNAGGITGLLLDAALSALATATTDYVRVARNCNFYALSGDLPKGKYNEKAGADGEEEAGDENVKFTLQLSSMSY